MPPRTPGSLHLSPQPASCAQQRGVCGICRVPPWPWSESARPEPPRPGGGERPREGPAVAPSEALGVTFFQAPEPRTQADAGAGPLQRPQVLAEQLAWLGPARVWRGLSGGAAASGGVRVRCCETDPPRWWCVVLMWQTATRAQAAGAGLAGGCEGHAGSAACPAGCPAESPERQGGPGSSRHASHPLLPPHGPGLRASPQAGPSGDTQSTPALTLARQSSVWPCMTL